MVTAYLLGPRLRWAHRPCYADPALVGWSSSACTPTGSHAHKAVAEGVA
jgi:hypothetical protein